jgi:hypothetical protein
MVQASACAFFVLRVNCDFGGTDMIDYSIQNKRAWEFNAYDFWVKEAGMPVDRAKKIVSSSPGAATGSIRSARSSTL